MDFFVVILRLDLIVVFRVVILVLIFMCVRLEYGLMKLICDFIFYFGFFLNK